MLPHQCLKPALFIFILWKSLSRSRHPSNRLSRSFPGIYFGNDTGLEMLLVIRIVSHVNDAVQRFSDFWIRLTLKHNRYSIHNVLIT